LPQSCIQAENGEFETHNLSANREVLVAFLRYKGHRLLEAEDGHQRLAVVQAEHTDLVITDVLMPFRDGYECVRQLRLGSTDWAPGTGSLRRATE
jgi:CheY-like chemotaxis protein